MKHETKVISKKKKHNVTITIINNQSQKIEFKDLVHSSTFSAFKQSFKKLITYCYM